MMNEEEILLAGIPSGDESTHTIRTGLPSCYWHALNNSNPPKQKVPAGGRGSMKTKMDKEHLDSIGGES